MKIIIPDIELHSGQRAIIDNPARFKVISAGRRFGKTLAATEWLALSPGGAIYGATVGFFAPNFRTMVEVWSSMEKTLAPIIKKANRTEMRMELVTGGTIEFWSLENKDSGRGRKYHRIIVDEAAHSRNLKEAWERSISPTLADYKGHAWFISTPNGINYFHELYLKGLVGENGWYSWKMPTTVNPHIDPEEIQRAADDLPALVFSQEFCHLPDTLVAMFDGSSKRIDELEVGDVVTYWNQTEILPCKILARRRTGEKQIVRITLKCGRQFSASVGHKLKVFNDEVKIDDVKFVEFITPDYNEVGRVVKREMLGKSEVWNITVDSPDHSYLLASGLNNYNCAEFVTFGAGLIKEANIHAEDPPPGLPMVIGVDLAISTSTKADYTAIIVMCREPVSGKIYIVSAERHRLGFNDTLEKIKSVAKRYNPAMIAIEQVQYQAAIVQEMLRTTNYPTRGIHPSKDKMIRFSPLLTRYEKNMVRHSTEVPKWYEQEIMAFPEGDFDDACLVAGTLILTDQGQVKIEDIKVGDFVVTRKGLKPVLQSGMTNKSAVVYKLSLENESTLIGTGNHLIFAINDFKPLNTLKGCDMVYVKTGESTVMTSLPKVVSVRKMRKTVPVYNLTVDECPEYFANNILVHNCDAAAYAFMALPGGSPVVSSGKRLF